MGFWIFILITNLIIPITMIGIGRMFMNYTPKEINSVFGYRTNMSMKNKDTWEFAHKHIGKTWFMLGLIIFLLSILLMLFYIQSSEDTISKVCGITMGFQVLILIASIFPTQKALNRTFDKNGIRK